MNSRTYHEGVKTPFDCLPVALCLSLLIGGRDARAEFAGAIGPADGFPPAREAGGPGGGSKTAPASPSLTDVPSLIETLGDDNPRARDAAGERLLALGGAARPALLEAAGRAEMPEVRGRCAALLLKLPWGADEDPSPLRQMLANYGRGNEQQRIQLLAQINQRGSRAAFDVLLRVASEDPSDEVRWAAVNWLKDALAGHEEQVRRLNTDAAPAPVLALAGMAWAPKDPEKAAALTWQALQAEAARPSRDAGASERVEQDAYYTALLSGDPARAAGVLRLRHLRGGVGVEAIRDVGPGGNGEVGAEANANPNAANVADLSGGSAGDEPGPAPPVVVQLFVLHGTFGPLPGFETDARAYSPWLGDPQVMYALGRAYGRGGRALLERACYRSAFAAGAGDREGRVRAGEFLLEQQWDDLAEAEFRAALAGDGEAKTSADLQARWGLARLATAHEDDAAAVEHLEALLDIARSAPATTDMGEEFQAEINWHRLRLARAKHDNDEANKLLAALMASPPLEGDGAIDVVMTLKELNRADDAQQLFQDLYRRYKEALDAEPANPMRMNNIAWLCARTGERLDEAVALSQAAMKGAPTNYAYLDTAAEALFRVGRKEEAARLETRALHVKPNDRFMQGQLRKFGG